MRNTKKVLSTPHRAQIVENSKSTLQLLLLSRISLSWCSVTVWTTTAVCCANNHTTSTEYIRLNKSSWRMDLEFTTTWALWPCVSTPKINTPTFGGRNPEIRGGIHKFGGRFPWPILQIFPHCPHPKKRGWGGGGGAYRREWNFPFLSAKKQL